jgi:hypothetical protein
LLNISNVTDSTNEFFLRNKVGLVKIEFFEQALPPKTVFVEEEQKVLEIDLALNGTLRQVFVNHVQDVYFFVGDWVTRNLLINLICSSACLGIAKCLGAPTQFPIFLLYN